MVLYRAGTFLLRRGGQVERARVVLRRSTEIDPSFGPAWVTLTASYMAAGEFTDRAVASAETAHRLFPSRTDVAANLLRFYLETGRRREAVDLARRALSAEPYDRAAARAAIVRSDLQRAHEALAMGDTEAAERALAEAETTVSGASGEELLRQRLADLHGDIDDLLFSTRYDEAAILYNDGEVEEARRILIELQAEGLEGRHAQAVDDFLEYLDDPESGTGFEAKPALLAEASRGEIDRLNELIERNELEAAIVLLEELDRRVSRDEASWIDLKIAELRRAIAHNRFVETFNTAVDQFNAGDYAVSAATLEALLADQPDAPLADDARDLLADARAELEGR
jgi:Flp pilus assembly protein TadD